MATQDMSQLVDKYKLLRQAIRRGLMHRRDAQAVVVPDANTRATYSRDRRRFDKDHINILFDYTLHIANKRIDAPFLTPLRRNDSGEAYEIELSMPLHDKSAHQ